MAKKDANRPRRLTKIVSISLVRDEEDIIESFVRYHCQFFDRMLVLNHRSSDRTGEILAALRQEGLPLEVLNQNCLHFIQSRSLTDLMQAAARDFEADWIIPLDADEFLRSGSQSTPAQIISKLSRSCLFQVAWETRVPQSRDDSTEIRILRRIEWVRRIEQPLFHKIIVPRSLALEKGLRITRGSHLLIDTKPKDWKTIAAQAAPADLVLSHYPLRSPGQFALKAIRNHLWGLVDPDRNSGEGEHTAALYAELIAKAEAGEDFRHDWDLVSRLSYNYAKADQALPQSLDLEYRPFAKDHANFSLRYTHHVQPMPFAFLLKSAKELALELVEMRKCYVAEAGERKKEQEQNQLRASQLEAQLRKLQTEGNSAGNPQNKPLAPLLQSALRKYKALHRRIKGQA